MPNARSRDRSEETIESIRRSLVELRRMFQRKELSRVWAEASGRSEAPDYTELRLLDAIHVCGDRGASVGDVAVRLGIDPSRASRQVASAVRRGLLTRRPAPDDARRLILAITPRGAKLQTKGGDLTRARIAVAIAGWPEREREAFEALLARFVSGIVPIDGDG
jgi:DNA-binding MarR family transcriptional regulator